MLASSPQVPITVEKLASLSPVPACCNASRMVPLAIAWQVLSSFLETFHSGPRPPSGTGTPLTGSFVLPFRGSLRQAAQSEIVTEPLVLQAWRTAEAKVFEVFSERNVIT